MVAELPQHLAAVEPRRTEQVAGRLGELEIAREALRVAEGELAEQRRQIELLVARHERTQRWRDELFALLPVGTLATDSDGNILESNAAAADLFGVRPLHLPGKPLVVFIHTRHRRLVRDLLGRLARGGSERHATVTVVPRTGEPLTAELVALPDAEGSAGILRWVLVPHAGLTSAEPRLAQPDEDGADESLRIAAALAQLCTVPVDADDEQRVLSRIAPVIAAAIPGAPAVSITIGDPVAPDRLASDSTEAQVIDGLQLRLAEGPCVDAYRQGAVVVAADVSTDPRWPRLAAAVRSREVRGALALPIRSADQRTGVINLYSTAVGGFETRTVRVGEVVASAVAAVLRDVNERASLRSLSHHLERALSSRAVIEQAKGIVIAHHGGTADDAFARLVAYSSRRNVKLRELAELIVHQGAGGPLPEL